MQLLILGKVPEMSRTADSYSHEIWYLQCAYFYADAIAMNIQKNCLVIHKNQPDIEDN